MELEDSSRSQFSELVRYSRAMMTALGVFTLLIMVVGVMGNVLTALALLRNSKIRTVAAAFIASLCISDLTFCFIVLPFAASQFFHGTWIHGDVLCTLIPVLRYGSVGVSLLSIAMISANRYILIAWPHLYPRLYTRASVAASVAAVWLFSYGLQVPTLLGRWGVFGLDERLGTCSIKPDAEGRTSKTAMFVIGFALPCVVIVVCYANIFWVVRRSHRRLKQHSSGGGGGDGARRRSEMKVTKMVLVIFVCFVVCYLPITAVKIFDPEVRHAPLHALGYILIYISSCVNPVVYVTMNRQYRQAYLDTLRCRYGGTGDSQHTHSPHSRMSVGYLKNAVNAVPKV